MTQATVNTKTLANGLIAVYSAMTLSTRADGSSFRAISEMHPDCEDVRSIVHDLHEGELPNDWRYETIYSLANMLLEYQDGIDAPEIAWGYDEFMEFVPGIAADLVDVATGDLLEWAKIGSRIAFWDEPIRETSDIIELLQLRQREEIEMMGYNLLKLVEEKFT